jgi:hypothetical protein
MIGVGAPIWAQCGYHIAHLSINDVCFYIREEGRGGQMRRMKMMMALGLLEMGYQLLPR